MSRVIQLAPVSNGIYVLDDDGGIWLWVHGGPTEWVRIEGPFDGAIDTTGESADSKVEEGDR